MKLVISIPVHEKPDVIMDQILNIKKYCENPIIVLHISKSFFDKYTLNDLQNLPNVYINPENLETGWGNILLTHVSNYYYIKELVEFDYFMIHASNDMYIRPGIENYITKFEAGFCRRNVIQPYTMWWPAQGAWNDKQLRNIMGKIGQSRIIATQVEGSFYKKNIADRVMQIIKENYRMDKELAYTREEIYFSTIASCFVEWSNVGYPTTYSEVHVFDRELWKIRTITRKLYFNIFKIFFSENTYYKFEKWYNDKMFESRFYQIKKKTIDGIRNNNLKLIKRNSVLNDYPGYFRLYDSNNVYSVKRITRNYNDKIRTYIRNLEV